MSRGTKMNSITTPELLAAVNPKNLQLLDDFLEYLKSVQRSPGTIHGYKNDIEIAWVWNLQHNDNIFYCDWTKRQVVRYQNWLINDNENSPARVRRLKAALSSMGNYVENILDEEYPDFRNIINKIESPAEQAVRKKTVFTEEQINELLKDLSERQEYDRACALSLAVCSGRRKAELLRYKVSDFDEDRLVCEGALYKSAPIKTKGRGAHGKMLECFCLANQFKPYFNDWMKYREENGIESEWLFFEKENHSEQMPISTLNSWAKVFSRRLGVSFYWHALRHMTVTSFKRAGIPDTVIQQYMGWTDISMVPVYTDMDADEQLGMYFSGDGIVIPEERGLESL